jgi:hypothetical protein
MLSAGQTKYFPASLNSKILRKIKSEGEQDLIKSTLLLLLGQQYFKLNHSNLYSLFPVIFSRKEFSL